MGLLDNPIRSASARRRSSPARATGSAARSRRRWSAEGVRTVFADVNRETVTAAIKASARPELAVPWVGDLADPAARERCWRKPPRRVGRVTHFVHSASPPRREADHALGVTHGDLGADACGES